MPRPTGVLGGEVKERACNMGEVTDETPVEVDKAQERLNLLLISWRGPLLHSSHLNRVHLSGIMGDNEPKVFDTGLLKLALLWLQEQLMLAKVLQD
ncbi:hypothetical protein H0H93_003996 [Arthromyces matolae]|nr:hypothetical protein H0H93_003996 [Arthromyces matolae]